MLNIEEISKKFNKLQYKLKISNIDDLKKDNFKSILSILNPNQNNLLFQSQKKEKKTTKQPIANQENNPNLKIKEKNMFFTQKYPEQSSTNTNNIPKEKSPKNQPKKNNLNEPHNIDDINKTQNNNNIKQQNNNSNNNSKNNNNSLTNNKLANLNLIELENGDIKYKDVPKILQKEEERKSLEENNHKNEKKVENEEIGENKNIKNISEGEGDIDDDSFIDEDEIEKKKTAKKDEINNINKFSITKKESTIVFSKTFNIFDDSKMMIDDEDILSNFNNNNESDDYNNNETNNNIMLNEKNDNNINNDKIPINEESRKSKNNSNKTKSKLNKDKSKSNKEKEKNRNSKINTKNNSNNKIEKNTEEQQNNANKINENDGKNNDNNNLLRPTDNNLKISIMLDEEDYINYGIKDNDNEEKNRNEKKAQITPIKNNDDRYKENEIKKKDNHQNLIRKKNIKSKSCYNPLSSNITISNKINKKVITDDDEDEENYDFNNKDNNENPQSSNINTNDIYLSSSKANKNKSNSTNNNINNETDKKAPIIKTEGNKFTFLFVNDINNNNNSINNIARQNINKDKDKDKNKHKENYDLTCIDNICKILEEIEKKLKKDNIDERIDTKCYEMIQRIKSNNTELYRRKRNTYLCILKILELLFKLLHQNKKIKNYIIDLLNTSDLIHEYFQNIKKYDSSIVEIPYFHKKKIAFKYIYSSLELKAYDNIALKELTKNKNYNTDNAYNDLLKFAKIYKRYKKSSEILIKEFKDFKEKINKYKTKLNAEYLNKYEHYLANIQTMPNFINYMKLFEHFIIVLNFYNDLKKFMEEIDKKDGFFEKRDRSVKVKNDYDSRNKNRERSRYKEIEKEGKK